MEESLTEPYLSKRKFTLAFLPVKQGSKLSFTDRRRIFSVIRKYKDM